jgi:hypothetical protein
MPSLANRVRMTTATTGTGTITLGTAVPSFQSFADGGILNGDSVFYVIEQGADWEIGRGTYTSSGTTMSRTVAESSNSDAPLNLTGGAQVYITPTLATFNELPRTDTVNTFTATQTITPAANTSALTSTGYSLTGSNAQSLFDLAGTWNTTGTPTAIRLNVTDTASNAASLLMDLGTGGGSFVSRFNVRKSGRVFAPQYFIDNTWDTGMGGNFTQLFFFRQGTVEAIIQNGGVSVPSTSAYAFTSGAVSITSADLFLTRRGAANLRLGQVDAAAPVAQTLSVQSVVAGTTNTAGANFTITGSQGTGSGAGGSIIFQVAPAGAAPTVQNTLVDALTIDSTRLATFNVGASFPGGSTSTLPIQLSASNYGFYRGATQGGQAVITTCAGSDIFAVGQNNGIGVVNIGPYSFATAINATADVFLYRDDQNILAQRNGTAAQEFRVYGSFTNASNYGRLEIVSGLFGVSGAAVIRTTAAGTGTVGRLYLGAAGGNQWFIDTSGNFVANADNLYDIGASGATRPRDFFLARNFLANGYVAGSYFRDFNNRFHIYSGSTDGTIVFYNQAETGFERMMFGGTTSSFPALKRVAANLQVIAADNSGSAGFIVGNQALATTATDGFLYVPTCAGTPTGTPTTQTGTAPIVVDTTNNKLYFYSGGAWRDAGP